VRVLIFHGYLLRGTGSNVYNAELAPALVALGHEVHLLAQDRTPEELDWVDAVGTWPAGRLEVRERAHPVRCTVYRPEIGGVLPVYVADAYDGIEARPYPELTSDELVRYLEANVAAVREVAERAEPDVALANHLVMGPVILARALGPLGVSYAVKVHGSALEYTVKPHPRFLPYAREGVSAARGVLVGSRHTAESLWTAVPEPGLREKTRLGPPGVDVHAFRPRDRDEARAELRALAEQLREAAASAAPQSTGSAFARDLGAGAEAVDELIDAGEAPIVTFVGKLIVSKGVDLLLAAWPLVLERVPDARLAVVGFGALRPALERLAAALAAGDLAAVRAFAAEGRGAEGGPPGPLSHLMAFLDALEADPARRDAYARAATGLADRLVWIGRLEHAELALLLPACTAQVVPSTFPEAFGMVAAEAAACGLLPLSAAHSGLAEVSAALAAVVPEPARAWLSFAVDDRAVSSIAERLCAWLEAPADLRAEVARRLAAEAARRYGWESVARGVIAAAEGRLGGLPPVPSDTLPGR
jgi:glycosyltransferase involved in cell wall biosynthesis